MANHLPILPKFLQLKSVVQMLEYDWHVNRQLPWVIEPGESVSTAFRRETFIEGMTEKAGASLFRLLPWRSRATLFRHRVRIGVSTKRKAMQGAVDEAITLALEDALATKATALAGR